MTKPAWTWADYERCKRAEERKAARAAAKAAAAEKITSVVAQGVSTADDASGCEGRAPAGSSGPAPVEVSSAPSPHSTAKARQSRNSFVQAMKLPPNSPPPMHPTVRHAIEYDARNRGAPSPFDPSRKIDLTAAPSGMEAAAARWEGKGIAPGRLAQSVPVLCAGKVMCRCGAQGPGQTRGPVPVWFGEKCIEATCELRGRK